jgi:hypothetical protein
MIINSDKLTKNEIMANLSLSEIKKRSARIPVLVSKLVDKTPFELTGSKKFVATSLRVYNRNVLKEVFIPKKKNDKDFKDAIDYLSKKATASDKIVITDGFEEHTISQIVKNSEFGGKGAGGGLIKEEQAQKDLQTEIDEAIKKNKGPITVKCGSIQYKNIVGVEKTSGTPKSDFHLINSDGTAVVWISHKDGSTAKDFQQWGGISERKEPKIFNHPETQKFITDLKRVYPQGLPPATTVYRHIKDKNLKFYSVYGNNYGGQLGEQNVTILLQGPPGLKKVGNNYELTANHVHLNGDSVDGDGFDPVLMAIYKGDRSDAGVKGTRIVISPVGGRKGTEFPSK